MNISFNTKVIWSREYNKELETFYKSITFAPKTNETEVRNRFEDKIKFFYVKVIYAILIII